MMAHSILYVGVAVAIIYPIVMRLLLEKMEPVRLKMVELGTTLLNSPTLSDDHKNFVCRMLADAYEWRVMPFALSTLPVFAWMRLRGELLSDPFADITDNGDRFGVVGVVGFFVASVAAANPVVTIVVILQFLVLGLVLQCARSIDSGIAGMKAAALRAAARTEASRAGVTI